MPKPTHARIASLLVTFAALGGAVAHGEGGAGFVGVTTPECETRAGMSLDQAIQMVEQQYHARVVRASVGEDNGRRVYLLRLVSEQGRVWTVRVDAATGATM